MATAGIRELKQNASAIVARAAAGESITVTDRGRAAARLTPLEKTTIDRLYAAGLATPPRRSFADLEMPTRSAGLSAALASMRDEERY